MSAGPAEVVTAAAVAVSVATLVGASDQRLPSGRACPAAAAAGGNGRAGGRLRLRPWGGRGTGGPRPAGAPGPRQPPMESGDRWDMAPATSGCQRLRPRVRRESSWPAVRPAGFRTARAEALGPALVPARRPARGAAPRPPPAAR